jgi:hypothetical protein
MTALKVLLILVILCLLIGSIRFGAEAEYTAAGLGAYVRVLWLRIPVFPPKKQTPEERAAAAEKKRQQQEKAKEKAAKKAEKRRKKAEKRAERLARQGKSPKEPEQKPKKQGGSLQLLLQLIHPALEALGQLKDALRFDRLVLRYTIPGKDDPAGAALQYGTLCAGGGVLTPLLENCLNVKERELSAEVDFDGTEALVYADLTITLTVGQVLLIALRFGWKFLCINHANRRQNKHKKTQEGK